MVQISINSGKSKSHHTVAKSVTGQFSFHDCLEAYCRLTQLSGSSLFILTQRSHDFNGMSTVASVVSVAPVVTVVTVVPVALGVSAVV